RLSPRPEPRSRRSGLFLLEVVDAEAERPAILRHDPGDRLGYTVWHLGLDLQGDLHPGPEQAGEGLDHLLCHLARVAADPEHVQVDRPVEAPGPARRGGPHFRVRGPIMSPGWAAGGHSGFGMPLTRSPSLAGASRLGVDQLAGDL